MLLTNPNRIAAAKPLLLVLLVLIVFGAAAFYAFQRRPSSFPFPPIPGSTRLAALSPALAVTLRDLKLSHLIVSRHKYDLILNTSVPVGWDEQPDYESLLAAHPTHILLQLQSARLPARLPQLAAANNWRIIDISILTLDDIKAATTRLAELFAPGADVPLLKEMDRAWSRGRGGGRPDIYPGRVLLLAALDPPSALGPGSWHHQILERIGGTPAITQGSPYITLDAEDVLHMKPDAIILILPRDRSAPPASLTTDALRRHLGRLGTLDIPAVSNSRLALIDDPLAHTPSTAMIHLADEMAAILERWNSK